MPFEVLDGVHHRCHLGRHAHPGHKVGGEALFEVFGLANINDPPGDILHQVDAWGVRSTPGLRLG